MNNAPKGSRLTIGIFGRTNTGKSTFLNLLAAQDVAMTSDIPGTTTDVVRKGMELLRIGPVTLLDTAGLEDTSELGEARQKKTAQALDQIDIMTLLLEADQWNDSEEQLCQEAKKRNVPIVAVINKTDINSPSDTFLANTRSKVSALVSGSAISDGQAAESFRVSYKNALLNVLPKDITHPPVLVGDLLPAGGLVVLVVPIDLQAPQGRLILPQVQTIRDALDHDAASLVVKEREYAHYIQHLGIKPDLVVCDSQVVARVAADTPSDIPLTTFSILLSRLKGDLGIMSEGAAVIDQLRDGDKVLIAEGCSHHALEDDIGRVKITRWLRQYTGSNLHIDVFSGHDYPDNLEQYRLVVHCGGCMLNRKQVQNRIQKARACGVAITNYGICISVLQGVARRALSPFPDAMIHFP